MILAIIAIACIILVILYYIGKITARILAVTIAFGLLFTVFSILFAPHISKLNSYYYSGYYEDKAMDQLKVINSSINTGEPRASYINQIDTYNNYVYDAGYSLSLMCYFKETKEKKFDILSKLGNTLANPNIEANNVISSIQTSLTKLKEVNNE